MRATLFAPYIYIFMTRVRGLSDQEYGYLQAIYYVCGVMLEVPSGVFADGVGRRWALLVGAVATCAGCATMALAQTFWIFALGELLFAVSTAFISGADSALLFDSLAVERRESEYARAEGAGVAAWLGCSAIGLPLADLFLVRGGNPVLTYWVTGFISLIACGLALAMREPPRISGASSFEITKGAFREVARSPGILRIIVYSVGVFLLLRAAIVSFFNRTLEECGVAVDDFGKVLAVVNVVGALAAYYAHRALARFGERACLVAMPVMLLAMYAALLPLRVPAAALLFTIQGAVFGVYPLVVRSILNRQVTSSHRRATVLSIESLACRLAFAAVSVYAGWSLHRMPLSHAMGTTVLLSSLPLICIAKLRQP